MRLARSRPKRPARLVTSSDFSPAQIEPGEALVTTSVGVTAGSVVVCAVVVSLHVVVLCEWRVENVTWNDVGVVKETAVLGVEGMSTVSVDQVGSMISMVVESMVLEWTENQLGSPRH